MDLPRDSHISRSVEKLMSESPVGGKTTWRQERLAINRETLNEQVYEGET